MSGVSGENFIKNLMPSEYRLRSDYQVDSLSDIGLNSLMLFQGIKGRLDNCSFLLGLDLKHEKVMLRVFKGYSRFFHICEPVQDVAHYTCNHKTIVGKFLCERSPEFKDTFDFLMTLCKYDILKYRYARESVLYFSDYDIIGRVAEKVCGLSNNFIVLSMSTFIEVATETSRIPTDLRKELNEELRAEVLKNRLLINKISTSSFYGDSIDFTVSFKGCLSIQEIKELIRNNRKALHSILSWQYKKGGKGRRIPFDYFMYDYIRLITPTDVLVSMKLKAAQLIEND